MIGKLFRRMWIEVLVALDESYTIEGFKRTRKKFELPEHFRFLNSVEKRKVTICNLFASHSQSMGEIVRVLDVPVGQVVSALIENDLIKERRGKLKKRGRERRQHLPIPQHTQPEVVAESPAGIGKESRAAANLSNDSTATQTELAASAAATGGLKSRNVLSRSAITTLGLNKR